MSGGHFVSPGESPLFCECIRYGCRRRIIFGFVGNGTRKSGAASHLTKRNCYYNPCCAALAKVEELTGEEKAAGVFTREIPEDGAHFKVYFENKYGIWTQTMIKF